MPQLISLAGCYVWCVGTKACLAPVHAVEMDAITVKICSVNCRGGVDMESLAYSYTPVLSLPHDSFNFR